MTGDVDCAGCDRPTPYVVGKRSGEGSFGEHLNTPLGYCRPVKLGPTDEDRKREQLSG